MRRKLILLAGGSILLAHSEVTLGDSITFFAAWGLPNLINVEDAGGETGIGTGGGGRIMSDWDDATTTIAVPNFSTLNSTAVPSGGAIIGGLGGTWGFTRSGTYVDSIANGMGSFAWVDGGGDSGAGCSVWSGGLGVGFDSPEYHSGDGALMPGFYTEEGDGSFFSYSYAPTPLRTTSVLAEWDVINRVSYDLTRMPDGVITGHVASMFWGVLAYTYDFTPNASFNGSGTGGGSGKNWSSSGNWGSGVPNAAGAFARFDGSASAFTVSVDSATSVGYLVLDSSTAYTINGPQTLTLDQSGVNAQVCVQNGSHTIAAAVHLATSTDFNVTGSSLSISGVISGSTGASLNKHGPGTLVLSGTNTYTGGTNLTGGTLVTSSSSSLGASTSTVTVMAGGVLQPSTSYTLPQPLLFAGGSGTVSVGTSITLTHTGTLTGPGGLTKAGAGTFIVKNVRTGGVAVSGGTVKIAPQADPYDVSSEAGTSKVTTLSASGGLIDLTNTKIITQDASMIDTPVYDSGNDIYIYDGVHGLVQKGRSDGTWNGTSGITTSQTDATTSVLTSLAVGTGAELRGLGPGETEVFSGQTINGNSTIVMYTYGGDADMDGDLDGDDYFAIDSNVLQSETVFGWHQGDFNYDGRINGDDYFIIDSNTLPAQLSGDVFWTRAPEFARSSAGGLTAVPEPATVGLIGITAIGLMRRRRRIAAE